MTAPVPNYTRVFDEAIRAYRQAGGDIVTAQRLVDEAFRHGAVKSCLSLGEIKEAWDRHHKRNGRQVWQVVLQTIIGKLETIDAERFRANHQGYCEFWTRRGWSFCSETLMDWIDNGCNPPPPEAEKQSVNTRTRRIAERS